MQLGIRLHDSENLPLEQRLAAVRAQGFTCAHIALAKLGNVPATNTSMTPGYATYLRRTFETAGIDIAVLGCYLNLAHPDPVKLHELQQRYIAHMRFASLLGCSVVGTETGSPNAEYAFDIEASRTEEALETFITNLKPVVKAAESFGVIVAIEPVYKHIVHSPERASRVLDEIESPNLQIIFDPVNLLHPDNLDRRDEILGEAMDLLGDDIAIIHLKDYVLEDGEMKAVGCGFGEMKYDDIVKFAVEKKPYIQATLENTKPDTAERSRLFIKSIEDKYCM